MRGQSVLVVRLPPLTAHRSPLAVHHAPCAATSLPLAIRRALRLSLSPAAPYSRPITPCPFALLFPPIYFHPSTASSLPLPALGRQPAVRPTPRACQGEAARRDAARAGHDARRPSAFGALTNPCKTCPLRMPRDHACKHGKIGHAMQPNRACPQSIVPSTDTRRPPGRRLRVPRDRAHARLCTRRHAVAQETHQKGSPMHESKSFDAGLARRGTTATTRPARQASAAASTRRRHAARAPPPKASRLPPTARHDVAGMRVAHRPPPNPTRTPARPSAPRRECAPARTNRSVLHRCAPRFANAAAARAAPGRARVNRRAWDALAPRSRRRLRLRHRHRHCRRPRPAARARRSSRAASAPAARAPDRRAQAA